MKLKKSNKPTNHPEIIKMSQRLWMEEVDRSPATAHGKV